jgi:hypothetical protein
MSVHDGRQAGDGACRRPDLVIGGWLRGHRVRGDQHDRSLFHDPMGAAFEAPGNTNSKDAMKYFSSMAWARVAPRLGAIKPVHATR